MKVIIAGASGFLGTALARHLTAQGHDVSTLVRRPPTKSTEIEWHPDRGELEPNALAGFDAVVCMSGAGIADHRWTEKYKVELRRSRTETVGLLARTMAAMPPESRPATFLSGSAMGFYGDRGSDVVTEAAPPGTDFLAGLCREWEAAASPAVEAGVRVVFVRTSNVLKAGEGLLKPLVPLFKMGGGGKLSTGSQYMSWIALDDWVRALEFALDNATVSGPINVCSPNPATNVEFTKALAAAVRRPAVMPVPKFALRIALGEFADQGALASLRLAPDALTKAGFQFNHPDLDDAMKWAVNGA